MRRAYSKTDKHLTSYLAEDGDLILIEREYTLNAWRMTIDELKALDENTGKRLLRSLWKSANDNQDSRVQYKGSGSFPELTDALRGHSMTCKQIWAFFDDKQGPNSGPCRRNWTTNS